MHVCNFLETIAHDEMQALNGFALFSAMHFAVAGKTTRTTRRRFCPVKLTTWVAYQWL